MKRIAAYIFLLTSALYAVGQNEDEEKLPSVFEVISYSKVLYALFLLVVGYFLIKLVKNLLNLLAERSAKYRITLKSLIPIVQIIGWISLVLLVIIGVFKPPAATVLAFSASIGVAVGFASQDILKNIFGGLTILFDRPFMVGDKIEIGSYYGEVVSIGLRSTRIVTPDDSLVSIPNSEIVNKSVSNSNAGESNCQVVAEFYLSVDADIKLARKIAMEAAQVSRYVYTKKPIVVVFGTEISAGKQFLKMRLKAYVAEIRNEFLFKSDMTTTVIRELTAHDLMPK